MTSMLVRQCASLGGQGFIRQYDHDWILWEPGAWTPPLRAAGTLPACAVSTPEVAGVALALVLRLKPGKSQVTLGRGKDCDLEINDGTLSAVHLVFSPSPSGWSVRDAGSKNGAALDGQKLIAHRDVPLRNAAKIACAQVQLSYYTCRGLWERLTGTAPPAE